MPALYYQKTNLGTAKSDFKKQFYNHKKSINNETTGNEITLSEYIWELKETSISKTSTLVWSIAKKVPPYLNASKKCLLWISEKLGIPNYPGLDQLLNKRSELRSKCTINKSLTAIP